MEKNLYTLENVEDTSYEVPLKKMKAQVEETYHQLYNSYQWLTVNQSEEKRLERLIRDSQSQLNKIKQGIPQHTKKVIEKEGELKAFIMAEFTSSLTKEQKKALEGFKTKEELEKALNKPITPMFGKSKIILEKVSEELLERLK